MMRLEKHSADKANRTVLLKRFGTKAINEYVTGHRHMNGLWHVYFNHDWHEVPSEDIDTEEYNNIPNNQTNAYGQQPNMDTDNNYMASFQSESFMWLAFGDTQETAKQALLWQWNQFYQLAETMIELENQYRISIYNLHQSKTVIESLEQ